MPLTLPITSNAGTSTANPYTVSGPNGMLRVNIPAVTSLAETQAKRNVQNSLGLEQQYAPGVAKTRSSLQDMVAGQLAEGGNIPTEIQNQVVRGANTGANQSGITGLPNVGALTARDLGMTALQLQQNRMNNATNLLAANPTPEAGLSPGAIGNLAVGDINATNTYQQQLDKMNTEEKNAKRSNTTALIGTGLGLLASFL